MTTLRHSLHPSERDTCVRGRRHQRMVCLSDAASELNFHQRQCADGVTQMMCLRETELDKWCVVGSQVKQSDWHRWHRGALASRHGNGDGPFIFLDANLFFCVLVQTKTSWRSPLTVQYSR